MTLAEILKDSKYKLTQFSQEEIDSLESAIFTKTVRKESKPHIRCLVRNKDIQLKPEEAIRQLYLQVLNERYGYPLSRMTVEHPVNFGTEKKKADIVIFDKDNPTSAYIIVELKRPKLKDGKDQLKSYCNATGAPIGVWTNGNSISFYHRKNPNYFEDITDIPDINQTLADILNEQFTLDDLIKKDKLVNERKSLKDLILEMEDEVLANAGVDVFEEVFKLVFTKLYDEWLSGRKRDRLLEFRNTGQTETALKNKIQNLFDRAKKKWEGVFSEDSKISLSPSHLSICVSSLENVKLFNSNLDVVDEAFEYLINKSSKGEKGQFFTPRYIIDMCVKMLNPKEDEYLIDPASGSAGFPVHSIFHVWRQILEDEGLQTSELFTLEKKPYRCEEYVREKVFAIDFDEKAVRVARTLNLIAGDGQTNVLHLNTLDFDRWDETVTDEDWQEIYFEGFKKLKKLRQHRDDFKEFKFDILMANPPFAGDIKESRLLAKYQLARKSNGKWETKLGRDILFIERNLDFLNPGGRMAVILPQGRFNNSSDKPIRDFIAQRCRILAVVGLHGNTFKPHTGTKTSVLFLQKWNDDPNAGELCPRVEDYNIFFATMRKSGKDNSGDKIWRKVVPKSDLDFMDEEREFLQDKHGHLIVDHDLFNHDGLTEDGIAEAFIEFAKKEKLSFFEQSLSVIPFDADKYQRLMDGLEAVELKLSETLDNKDFRIDSEFHRKPPLQNKNYKYVPIGNILKSVQYGLSIEMNEVGKGTKIYRMNEIHNMLCDTKVAKYANISNEEKHNYKLYDNDILFNRTNSFEFVGRTGIFKKFSEEDLVFASYLIRIKTDDSYVLPEYLVAFLNSNLGIWEIKRRARISINQSNVNAQELSAIQIPLLRLDFQVKLRKLFDHAHQDKLQALKAYRHAEDLLLSELNLKNWQPTEENIAVKSFSSSFLASDRLDADYYQPKYEILYKKLQDSCKQKKWQLTELGNLSSVFKYGLSDKLKYIDNGVPFLRIADLDKYRFYKKNIKYISQEAAPKAKQAKVNAGDVLISRSGTLGLTVVITESFDNAIFGSYFIRTRPDPNMINPTYLALYLNSLAGRLQIEQTNTGGVQTNLTIPTLQSLLIACPPLKVQQEFVAKVNKSYNLEDRSQQLLEIAKTGVEIAIETDENKAIEWINHKLEKLSIKLCDDLKTQKTPQ